MWILYAFLSAFFAALTSILAKIGMAGVNSHLATAIRSVVVLVMVWGVVFFTGKQGEIAGITHKSWLFIALSGASTALTWIFYYRALQLGDASKVIPIDKFSVVIGMIMAFVFLKETVDAKSMLGGLLIAIGTFVLVL